MNLANYFVLITTTKFERTLDRSEFDERQKKDINFNEKLYLDIKMCGRKRDTETI